MPEIGEDDPKLNPFIKADGFPEFSNVTIDHCLRRIGTQSTNLEETVTKADEYLNNLKETNQKLTLGEFFEKVLYPIEEADKELVASWGLAKTLFHANNILFPTKSFISLHQRARKANIAKYNSKTIYNAVCELNSTLDASKDVTVEQKRLLAMFELEGKLGGMGFKTQVEADELEYVNLKLSEEVITYESKVFVAVDHFAQVINDYSLVQSFPPDLLQAMALDKKNPLNGPWKVTLKPSIYKGFLSYCPDNVMRWNIWQADVRKASRQVVTELDNSGHAERIRDHRHRIAKLIGYTDYVQLKRDRLLLNATEKPQDIINELRDYARPTQEHELRTLNDFAIQSGFNGHALEEHDVPYWLRKYNINVCKYDENLIQEYFPIDKVFKGMFGLCEKLFGIEIVERNDKKISRWHENVKYFDVYDTRKSLLQADASKPIGGFFLDTCSLNDEHSKILEPDGFTVPIRENCDRTNSTPLVSLVYNFRAPLYGKPHTLKLREVHTVFSKFANTLQKILNESSYRELSGLINIEYVNDKVCSNLLSNLLYRSETLKSISEHISTKEPLTDEHIQAIQAQRLTLAGYNLSVELFKSAFDYELYATQQFWLEIMRRLYAKYFLFQLDKRDARLCSMTEIIAGNWSGSYFSLLWADLMAADICDAFDDAYKAKVNSNEALIAVGNRFRDTFLASGSNTDSLELFRNFRGRDPALEAFVARLQLKQKKTIASV